MKHISLKFLILIVMNFFTKSLVGQNCTVNAGSSASHCEASSSFDLNGNSSGQFSASPSWSLVSGPNTTSIANTGSLNTQVTGSIPGVYVYRLSAVCQDLVSVSDDVTITIDSLPKPKVNDTSFCDGGTIVPQSPHPSLPVGQSVFYSYLSASGVSGGSALTGLTPTFSYLELTDFCPKNVVVQIRMFNGTCEARDTFTITTQGAKNQTAFVPISDVSLCGTEYTLVEQANYGCNAVSAMIQLSGPSTATIQRDIPGSSDHTYTFSNLIQGTYTFVYTVTQDSICGANTYIDTFDVTIISTIAIVPPSFSLISVCSDVQDTVYYFQNQVAMPPGQVGYWNLSYNPHNLQLDTSNGVLRIRTQDPSNVSFSDILNYTILNETNTTFYFRYEISNGFCTESFDEIPFLRVTRTPIAQNYKTNIILPCNVTSVAIDQFEQGFGPVGGQVAAPGLMGVISRPAGSPTPIQSGSTFSNLVSGRYVFSFRYGTLTSFPGYACGSIEHRVSVDVSSDAGIANAGSNLVLPCGIDSALLSANFPVAGNKGSWEQISGPTILNLIDPEDPNLIIKNLLPGQYMLRWVLRKGLTCSSSDEVSVFVTRPEGVGIHDTLNICYGNSQQIMGSQTYIPGTYGVWRQFQGPTVNISDSMIYNPIITGTQASETYGFEWIVVGFCDTFSDTIVIITSPNVGPTDAVVSTADSCLTTETSLPILANTPSSGSGEWKQVSGPSLVNFASATSPNTTVNNMTNPGIYVLVWEISASGCDSKTDTLVISKKGTTANYSASAPSILTFCDADTITLTGNLFSTSPSIAWEGNWYQVQGQLTTIEKVNETESNAFVLSSGVYRYMWVVGLGSCQADTAYTDVIINETPISDTIITNDSIVCGYTNLTNFVKTYTAFKSSNATTNWTVVGTNPTNPTMSNSAAASNNITFRGAGFYNVIYTSQVGSCEQRDTVTMELVPQAEAGEDKSICITSALSLGSNSNSSSFNNFNGTASPTWSQVSGPNTADIINPNARFTNVEDLVNGTYVFRYTLSHPFCGVTSDDVTIQVFDLPTNVDAGTDLNLCYNGQADTIELLGVFNGNSTSVLWTPILQPLNSTIGYNPNNTSIETKVSVSEPGLYQFRLTVNNGACQIIDFVDVAMEEVPVPTIQLSASNNCNDSVVVTSSVNIPNYEYAWHFEDAADFIDSVDVGLVGPLSNHWIGPFMDVNKKIKVTITNTNTGCFSSDSIVNNVFCLLLPVTLLDFNVKSNNKLAEIIWSTGNELNTSHFEVEKSTDGKIWEQIDYVKAAGFSYQTIHYSIQDELFKSGVYFYRLKMVDFDNSAAYSPIRSLVFSNDDRDDFVIYPNPTSSFVYIKTKAEDFDFKIFASNGMELNLKSKKVNEIYEIDFSNVAKGIYNLLVFNSNGLYSTIKIIVE